LLVLQARQYKRQHKAKEATAMCKERLHHRMGTYTTLSEQLHRTGKQTCARVVIE